jgi:hypothetical protein
MSLAVPLAVLIVVLLGFSAARRTRRRPPPLLERLDVDATEVRLQSLTDLRVPIAEVHAVRFDDQLLELTLARGGTRRFLVPPGLVDHVHGCVSRLSSSVPRPALPIVATTHDGLRLNLDPVFAPIAPVLAVFAAGGSALSVAAAALSAVLPHYAGRPSFEAHLVVVGLVLGVIAFVLGAAKDLRIELAVEGRRLVLRRANRWWRSVRSIPLADVREVRISWHAVRVIGPGRTLRIPLGQRSAATEAVVRRFVIEQVEQAQVVQGRVPAELARLVDRADAE